MKYISLIIGTIALTLSVFSFNRLPTPEPPPFDYSSGPFTFLDHDHEEVFRIEGKKLITKHTPMEVWLFLKCIRPPDSCDYCPYPPEPCIKS